MQKGRVTSSHNISYGPCPYIILHTQYNSHDNDIKHRSSIFFSTINELTSQYIHTELLGNIHPIAKRVRNGSVLSFQVG